MASASSPGVALGGSSTGPVSEKTGQTSRVQLGAMAGARAPRRAARMPATKVPCRQDALA
jgi:hypothetical protein